MLTVHNVKAYALLEIMISLGMSLLLLSGIYEVFNSIRQSSLYIQGLALIQENGQLASYLLMRELSQAGYAGCRKIAPEFPLVSHIQNEISPYLIVHGYNQQNLPNEAKAISKKMVDGSSVVSIQFMRSQTALLASPVAGSTSSFMVDNSSLFHSGDNIMIADCVHADVISTIRVNNNNTLECNANISKYSTGSSVGLWENESFYVGKTGRLDKRGQAIAALYVYQPTGRDEELVENVSNMHVQYAYLNASQQLQFVPDSQVSDWMAIKAIRVILLLNSGESILPNQQSLLFDNQNWHATDHKLYRQWELIVSLPNR